MHYVNRNQPDKPPSRKRRKREEPSLLWHFESMHRVNHAMQGTNGLEQVMKDVLDTLLSVFGCDRAWLVYGRVWAEGELNHGATFYFSLPRSKKEA